MNDELLIDAMNADPVLSALPNTPPVTFKKRTDWEDTDDVAWTPFKDVPYGMPGAFIFSWGGKDELFIRIQRPLPESPGEENAVRLADGVRFTFVDDVNCLVTGAAAVVSEGS
jgi:hypothetical protein